MTEPLVHRYFELSTDRVAPRQRHEFWRDTVLNRSDAHFREDAAEHGFSASVRCFIGDSAELRDGTLESGMLRRGAARCRQDGGDEILLTAVASAGEQIRYQDSGGSFTVPAGRLLASDMSVPLVLEMGRFRTINFRLSRATVLRTIRRWPTRRHGRLLPATPLTTLLFEQVVRFADALPAMDDAARAVALDATAGFAVAALRLEAQAEPWDEGARQDGLWLAAERFIERNLQLAELNPTLLARALRCSRSHLYRLFGEHDTTVMDHVREKRLRRSRELLTDSNCPLPIAEIAALCGMEDASAFSRAFRRRFGRSPGELRRARSEAG